MMGLLVAGRVAYDDRRRANQRGAVDERTSHRSWMRDIPDHARATTLNTAGTHGSCATGGPLGFGKTQNLDLPDQLNAGIRFLDIRLAHYQDNLFVHHDVVHMKKTYTNVLKICISFLKHNPSETILMSVKNEGRFDSVLGRFAPSELLGRSSGDPTNWTIRSSSFEHAFQARTWEHLEDAPLFYHLSVPPPGGGPVEKIALTSETTLEEVRGKIIYYADSRAVRTSDSISPTGRKISISEARRRSYTTSRTATRTLAKTTSASPSKTTYRTPDVAIQDELANGTTNGHAEQSRPMSHAGLPQHWVAHARRGAPT
jgi:1-phosphatidylinositol phosphodiesterase